MHHFKRLRKTTRREAIAAGIIRDVAKASGFTPATVSRTFAGRFDRPNPLVVAALRQRLQELKLS